MSRRDEEDQEEILAQVEAIAPMIALDPVKVDALTERQQEFLLAYLRVGHLMTARKQIGVDFNTWKRWLEDEHFNEMFEIVKSPLKLVRGALAAVQIKAVMRHWQLLDHPNAKIQKWAIELAYSMSAFRSDTEAANEKLKIDHRELKELASGIADQLDEKERERLEKRSPFAVVTEAEYKVIPESDAINTREGA